MAWNIWQVLFVCFAKTGKLILQFIWKYKGLIRAKIIFKKNEVGGFTLPDFKTCYKGREIKECGY